jgi:hypothetical protein
MKEEKGKGQVVPVYVMMAERWWGLVRSVVVNITPRPLYPMERNTVRTEEEAGWATDPVYTLQRREISCS